MALIRWQPFQEIETLRRQMDQMFDEMTDVKRETQLTWQPAIELKDTEDVPRRPYTTAGYAQPVPDPLDHYLLVNKVRFFGDRVAAVVAKT